MLKPRIEIVLDEVSKVLAEVSEDEVGFLVEELIKSKKIVVIGAGRVGLAAKAFAMRLMHLGKEAYTLNDCNLPSIGPNDFLLVCSGSGETQTIYDLVSIAKSRGVKIGLITGNKDSRMGKISDLIVQIKAPSKLSDGLGVNSIQPMTTLNEQCLWLFFDALVLELMERMQVSNEQMKLRHSILE